VRKKQVLRARQLQSTCKKRANEEAESGGHNFGIFGRTITPVSRLVPDKDALSVCLFTIRAWYSISHFRHVATLLRSVSATSTCKEQLSNFSDDNLRIIAGSKIPWKERDLKRQAESIQGSLAIRTQKSLPPRKCGGA